MVKTKRSKWLIVKGKTIWHVACSKPYIFLVFCVKEIVLIDTFQVPKIALPPVKPTVQPKQHASLNIPKQPQPPPSPETSCKCLSENAHFQTLTYLIHSLIRTLWKFPRDPGCSSSECRKPIEQRERNSTAKTLQLHQISVLEIVLRLLCKWRVLLPLQLR